MSKYICKTLGLFFTPCPKRQQRLLPAPAFFRSAFSSRAELSSEPRGSLKSFLFCSSDWITISWSRSAALIAEWQNTSTRPARRVSGFGGEGVRVSGRRHGANLGGEQAVFCGCPSWLVLKENHGEKPKSLWGPNPARKDPPFWAVCRSLEAKAAGEGPKTRPTAFQGSKAWNLGGVLNMSAQKKKGVRERESQNQAVA